MFEKLVALDSLLSSVIGDERKNLKVKKDIQGGVSKQARRRSTNERNMTRKTRTRQLRIHHTALQSGYCAVCHIPYTSFDEHVHSKRHVKQLGEDENFISLKGFDSLLELDDDIEKDDALIAKETNGSQHKTNSSMRRSTRASSILRDPPLSPGSDNSTTIAGHHQLRSRRTVNYTYMTPPQDEDSMPEKDVREFRELRSSTRLLHKLTTETNEDVWNSGRPKRSCNRQDGNKRPETPAIFDRLTFAKSSIIRSSELTRLNNEAENFLFPKKEDSSDDDEREEEEQEQQDQRGEVEESNHGESNAGDDHRHRLNRQQQKVKTDDEESRHSTASSESKGKRKRRTHAEAFILDNQKYYKFETPGSRLRYQGSYFSPLNQPHQHKTVKSNGEHPPPEDSNSDSHIGTVREDFRLNLEDYNFSFERVPRNEGWFQTFQRHDRGEEKYAFLSDDDYWNPFILPYQLPRLEPLDPKDCMSQYNQIKKLLLDPPSGTASCATGCSTTPEASNSSSVDNTATQNNNDDVAPGSDSRYDNNDNDNATDGATEVVAKPIRRRRRGPRVLLTSSPGSSPEKNPRKSPRQHASTLAILSSLIQQRKNRKSRSVRNRMLPTIVEEESSSSRSPARKFNKQSDSSRKNVVVNNSVVDYVSLYKKVEEEFAAMCDCGDPIIPDVEEDDRIEFSKGRISIQEILAMQENMVKTTDEKRLAKRMFSAKPGRKPGKRKKNKTGWPQNRNRRVKLPQQVQEHRQEDQEEEEEEEEEVEMEPDEPVQEVKGSLCDGGGDNCDIVVLSNHNSDSDTIDKRYQPYVRVQKLERNGINGDVNEKRANRSPKATRRGQRRRMPASPKSPRILRRPRGRWYRER